MWIIPAAINKETMNDISSAVSTASKCPPIIWQNCPASCLIWWDVELEKTYSPRGHGRCWGPGPATLALSSWPWGPESLRSTFTFHGPKISKFCPDLALSEAFELSEYLSIKFERSHVSRVGKHSCILIIIQILLPILNKILSGLLSIKLYLIVSHQILRS